MDLKMSPSSLVPRRFLFLFLFLGFLSHVIATPVKPQTAKQALRVTNAKINSVDDIFKVHEFVLVDLATGHETKLGEVSEAGKEEVKEDYENMQEYRACGLEEGDKIEAAIHPGYLDPDNPGKLMPQLKQTMTYWLPATEKQLTQKLKDGMNVWGGDSKEAFSQIATELKKHKSQMKQVLSIGTESMHSIYDYDKEKDEKDDTPPRPSFADKNPIYTELSVSGKLALRDGQAHLRAAGQITFAVKVQKELGGVKLFLQDKAYSDEEQKLFNNPKSLPFPLSGDLELIEDPGSWDIITRDTLLIAIGPGPLLIASIPLNKLPIGIITDSRTFNWGKKNPKVAEVFSHYDDIKLAPAKTKGLDYPHIGPGAATILLLRKG